MSKWILMPDSFKGTMSSLEICRLMREALLRHVPDAEVVSIPVADGGEGSVEAFLAAMGGHRVEVPCTGPDFRKISGFYGLLADGYTAVIEMAAAAGLPLMEGRLCAEGATTYGVGELILAAIRDGARRIILGLGGSATNDGGCGCAAALGVRFLDGTGAEYVPVGGTLDRLCRIDMSHRFPLLNGVEIVTMCDVDNPLCGPNGASLLPGATAVLTGEGRIDCQSLRGKVVIGIAHRARQARVPVVAVVGDVAPGAEDAYQEGVTAIVSTNRRAVPWEVARQSARADLCAALEDLFRLYNAFRSAR